MDLWESVRLPLHFREGDMSEEERSLISIYRRARMIVSLAKMTEDEVRDTVGKGQLSRKECLQRMHILLGRDIEKLA